MTIAQAVPLEDHVLFVETEDGMTGLFDLKPYLGSEAFEPLNDSAEFASVHYGGYFLEWPCGAGLSADTVEARLTPPSAEIAQQIRRIGPGAARRARSAS